MKDLQKKLELNERAKSLDRSDVSKRVPTIETKSSPGEILACFRIW